MRYVQNYSSRFRILKGGKISLVVSSLLGSATLTFASPTGGVVTTGNANISSSGTTTTITQSTQKASINWQSFNVGSNETVNFIQPSSSSVTLNRVIGNDGSTIAGHINANGQIFLLNPNGILFTKTSQVNVGSMVASTLNMSDSNFQKGDYTLSGSSTASVINNGTINTTGYAALIANSITNNGIITATLGRVDLAAGSKVTLNLNGNSLVSLTIDQGTYNALVKNGGIIQADGGSVYLTSQGLNTVLNGVVNNTGVIQAQSVGTKDGHIVLFAHGGKIQAGGTITTGKGTGSVETSGEQFTTLSGLNVTTGNWLLDPVDITIDATLASSIDTALISGSVTISTNGSNTPSTSSGETAAAGNGDITVAAPMSWSANTLTLSAGDSININAQMDLTSTAGLSLQYAQTSGSTGTYNIHAPVNIAAMGSFSTQSGTNATVNYTIVDTATELQNMNNKLGGDYVVGANIDLSSISSFTPIGNYSSHFTGIFDGLGHTVDKLTINQPSGSDIGLFGYSNGTIRDVGVTNATITGNGSVGGLAGESDGTVLNSYSTGSVTGTAYSNYIGGLVGWNYGIISNSYSTGSVTVGINSQYVGGLVGENSNNIVNSYATGNLVVGSSSQTIGGLVGWNYSAISNSYATGSVVGSSQNVGGLVGENSSNIANSFWDTTTSGTTTGIGAGTITGATGLSDSQMANPVNFTSAGWSTSIWNFGKGSSIAGYGVSARPFLIGVTAAADIPVQTLLFSGGYGTSASPFTITDWQQLQDINFNSDTLGGGYFYTLSNNLSNSTGDYTTYASSTANSSAGWISIGNSTTNFYGTFDGSNYTIDSLNINRPSNSKLGLFRETKIGSIIKNVGVTNAVINGLSYVGSLVGYNSGTVSNSYSTGNMTSGSSSLDVGGGLVGYNTGTITNSYSTSTVTGGNVGGLIGENYKGSVSTSYFTGGVSGSLNVGGLIGSNDGTVSKSYSTGSVSGSSYVGGFVGQSTGTISNSYATGNVTGSNYVGSFAGLNNYGTILNSYATGIVTGSNYVGGFVGDNSGTLKNSFWDTTTSGTTTGIGTGTITGATGLSDTQMTNSTNFTNAGWSTTIWSFLTVDASKAGYQVGGYPYLTGVTQSADIHTVTLFNGGYGTSASPFTITDWQQLQDINYNGDTLSHGYYYTLSNNLGTTTSDYTTYASATANSNAGWTPIGNNTTNFYGTFDGGSHTIDSLNVNQSANNYLGLFGISKTGSTIKNVGVTNVNINGNSHYIGGLVGLNAGTVTNSYSTGSVTGGSYSDYVGGLEGDNYGITSNSYSTGSVTGDVYVGGLAGENDGTVSNSYSTGGVIGASGAIGGLMGENKSSTVSNSYATGSVSGSGYDVGGLVGYNYSSTVSNSYSTGSVTGGSSSLNVGGLVGYNYSGTVSNSYSTGSVTGGSHVGGLVGVSYNAIVSKSFWDKTTSGLNISQGGTGLTDTQMAYGQIFKNATWNIAANSSLSSGAPTLTTTGTWQIAPLALSYTLNTQSSTYNGTNQQLSTLYPSSTIFGSSNYAFLIAGSDYHFSVGGTAVSSYKDAGMYSNIQVASNNSFLAINSSGNTVGTFTINKKTITASFSAGNKAYDGSTTATVTGSSSGIISGDTVGFTDTSANFDTKDVGTGKTVTINGIALSSAQAGDYQLSTTTATTTANITQRQLSLSATKNYDETTDLTGDVTIGNLASGETLGYSGAKAFSPNIGGDNYISAITLSDGSGVLSNYILPSLTGASAANRVIIGTNTIINSLITPIENLTAFTPKKPTEAPHYYQSIHLMPSWLHNPPFHLQMIGNGVKLPLGLAHLLSVNNK